ncbi:MAG TPA: inositol monophosphatase family protein, partial [Ilumatobacteraceae bacterium]|nr:inositol monophosphatase family protein [Ilumatobacteraceae bacterium]
MLAHDDVVFLFRLADAADAVSRQHFRSEELRTSTKVDGTPVSEVDRAVEEAMLALVRSEGADAVLGEEVGKQPGSSNRQWIFDGIDGTHNYADGRPGWGTIIALEVDGTVELGMVSAPLWGRRWWAVRGAGAWSASYAEDGSFDVAAAEPLRCATETSLADATTIVIPWEGLLLGWRNTVPRLFHLPESIRSQCFAVDAAMVAEGTLDASIIVFGGIWDFAATSLIVRESGGVFRDAWGGERLDTATGVFTNAALIDGVLARLAEVRPPAPDRPKVARTVSTPIGTPEEQAIDGWRAFGIRPLASMSARQRILEAPSVILAIVDERAANLERPLLGVTTDGTVRSGLRSLGGRK